MVLPGFFAGTEMPTAGWWEAPATELRMAPETTKAAVEPAGFRLQRLVELPPYHYGAIFYKY